MKSGYWTREFIAGLFHLITPYWNLSLIHI